MRTLRLNKSELWLVRPTGYTDKLDDDGFKTGEKILSFSTPSIINMSLYPNNGTVKTFGKGVAVEADYLAVSTDVFLKEDDLLFKVEPVVDFDTKYDYKVSNILESLNGNKYGLKVKV